MSDFDFTNENRMTPAEAKEINFLNLNTKRLCNGIFNNENCTSRIKASNTILGIAVVCLLAKIVVVAITD